jgi:hypothetical protein
MQNNLNQNVEMCAEYLNEYCLVGWYLKGREGEVCVRNTVVYIGSLNVCFDLDYD